MRTPVLVHAHYPQLARGTGDGENPGRVPEGQGRAGAVPSARLRLAENLQWALRAHSTARAPDASSAVKTAAALRATLTAPPPPGKGAVTWARSAESESREIVSTS